MLCYVFTMSLTWGLILAVAVDTTIMSKNSEITTNSPEMTTTTFMGIGCGTICCAGKNNSCRSSGLKIDGRGDPNGRCFCDEGCQNMGDCCFDFASACKAIDCQLSKWTEYSKCSADCGMGTKSRERAVLVKPRFGGQTCPDNLKESTICTVTECERTETEVEQEIEKETAKIILASYGKYRNMTEYNANMDIRKNLYYQYYNHEERKHSGYCSRFRVVSARRSCQSVRFPHAHVLQPGAVICVDCEQTAMVKGHSKGMCTGHGIVGVSTSWNAVTAGACSGWWQRLDDDEECLCGADGNNKNDFIFI